LHRNNDCNYYDASKAVTKGMLIYETFIVQAPAIMIINHNRIKFIVQATSVCKCQAFSVWLHIRELVWISSLWVAIHNTYYSYFHIIF
jgi:hypothetical protein